MRTWLLRSATIALVVLAACGDGRPNEDALAASMLITLDDLPAGWTEEIGEDGADPDSFDQCPGIEAVGQTGRATTGDFSAGDDSFSHAVAVFESAEAARAAVDRFEPLARCLVDAINAGELDDDEVEVTGASLSRGRTPERGEAAIHLRIAFHIRTRDRTGLSTEVDAHFDILAIAVGRIGSSIQTAGIFEPFDPSLLDQLVLITADRIEGAPTAQADMGRRWAFDQSPWLGRESSRPVSRGVSRPDEDLLESHELMIDPATGEVVVRPLSSFQT